MNKKVSIIYLVCGDEPQKYLERALLGVMSQSYAKQNLELVIVYNPIEKINQLNIIEELVKKRQNELPVVKIMGQQNNVGFSAGNNIGMKYALDSGADYIFLHNGDGYLHNQAIESLVDKMESDNKVGQAQAMIVLSNEINKINTSGNSWHYLSIGYCRDYHLPLDQFKKTKDEIGYASGAASMVRADLLVAHGLWKEDFFLYHEDTEYSLRLRSLGYNIILVEDAYFYHDYKFNKNKKKFFWIERNRQAIKLMYYKWPTLFLLFPIDLLYNIGLLGFAAFNGWLLELLKVYAYWLQSKNWKKWLIYRREIQKKRKVTDKYLLSCAVVSVDTEVVGNRLFLFFANLIFTFYGFLLKILVWW